MIEQALLRLFDEDEARGTEKATEAISDGVLEQAMINATTVGRSMGEVLGILKAFPSGRLCGSDGKPEQANLMVI